MADKELEFTFCDSLDDMERFNDLSNLAYDQLTGLSDPPDSDTLHLIVEAIREMAAMIDLHRHEGRLPEEATPREKHLYYLGREVTIKVMITMMWHRLIKQKRRKIMEEKSKVTLDDIVTFEYGPGVFRAYVEVTDHTDDYKAVAELRPENMASVSTTVSVSADSEADALEGLLARLVALYQPCTKCGGTGLERGAS